jgi:hypothetical protein
MVIHIKQTIFKTYSTQTPDVMIILPWLSCHSFVLRFWGVPYEEYIIEVDISSRFLEGEVYYAIAKVITLWNCVSLWSPLVNITE